MKGFKKKCDMQTDRLTYRHTYIVIHRGAPLKKNRTFNNLSVSTLKD